MATRSPRLTLETRSRVRGTPLRSVIVTLIALCAIAIAPSSASAHGVLVDSNPLEGAGLDTSPTAVVLTFSEEPEPSLSSITITDASGRDAPVGQVSALSSNPRSIVAQVPALEPGVYTVAWRVVSRVDGHATAGAFAFGVGMTPDQAQIAAAAESGSSRPSVLELVARWLFLGGLVVVIGASLGAAIGFARANRGWSVFDAGIAITIVGLGALGLVQRASARVPVGEFLQTYPGRAIIWRGVLLAIAALCGALARWRRDSATGWWIAAAAAAAACAGVHVAAGHAAAVRSLQAVAVISQWSHVVAAGAWVGGLFVLVLGLRGQPPDDAGAAIRRFSIVAGWALVLVGTTGTIRAIAGLNEPADLVSSGYGIAVAVKIVVFVALCMFGLLQRRRALPVATTTTAPLLQLARPELALAAVAVVASGVLGSLSPPADTAPPGLAERSADSTGELAAELTTQWRLPGPNTFHISFVDGQAAEAPFDDVTLRFRPLDDPGIPSTTLRLERDADGYGGRGSNLAFPGRWEVTAVAQAGARSWTVPFTLTTDAPPLFSTRTDLPGFPPEHIVQLGDNSFVIVSPFRDAAELRVRFADFATAPRSIDRVIVTVTDSAGRTTQLPVDRETEASFRVPYQFPDQPFQLGVVARDRMDDRVYATFDIDPGLPDA